MRMTDTNETLIVGVIIECYKKTTVPERFKGIFKGQTEIERGKYTYWYPIKNPSHSRLVNLLKLRYGMGVKYGVAGTMEI